jgi:predicted MFS family arabinose efflux permease
MLSFYSSYFFAGAHITIGLGLSTAQAGLLPLFYGFGFGLAVLFDPLLDRLGVARATPPVFVLISLTYLAMLGLADSYSLLLLLSLVWGVFQHLGLNLLVARLVSLDPGQRGAIMGLYSTVTYLCVFVAPIAGAVVYTPWGLAGCLALSATLCLLEALESLVSLRPGPVTPVSPDAPV